MKRAMIKWLCLSGLAAFLSACVAVERVPLVSAEEAGNEGGVYTIFFFDEDPERQGVVREVAVTKKIVNTLIQEDSFFLE